MPGIAVQITALEFVHAANAGFLRQASNLLHGRKDAHGFEGDGWKTHIEGAVGEFAVAKALGLFWPGVGRLRAPDVGELQVRSTPHPGGRLVIHPGDKDGDAYVLVRGELLRYEVVGWLRAGEGKLDRHWRDPTGKSRSAYFVPAAELHDISLLVKK